MKYIYFVMIFLTQLSFGSEPEVLKGIQAITVYSQIYPRSLNRSFETALIKALSQAGKVIEVITLDNSSENFYTAISNSTFLKLSLSNWIVEIEDAENKQFKVEMEIVLECSKTAQQKNSGENKILAWVGEEDFDFLPNEQKLTEIGCQAVEKLVKQFVREYQHQNANEKGSLKFYIL